ncbi:MAG TPA: PQQ-dependent sugar dehydrogenase, partial [Candidatus Binatia bacterium]|nr:PQQ-dependent sugar dehydrogenase [Candidatus Binatia bacterium]
IIRFQSTPKTFSLAPTGAVRFTDVFAAFPSSRSHQIGHMAVQEGALYVAVGDALHSSAGRDLTSVLGKVLRMTLDGKPLPDNPFFTGSAKPQPRDYVWSYGLRNPFGLVLADGRLFAAENGPGVDRFIAIERAKDYGYDGTDWSMGINALAVFAPSVGPAQAAWLPADASVFPAGHRGAFYLTFGGSVTTPPGPGFRGERSIVSLPFDMKSGRVTGSAQPILRYRGESLQMPVGVAFGSDGLYVVPIFPVRDGETGILRVSYDPSRTHPARIDRDESPPVLLATRGCNGCHASYEGRQSIGPSLDPPALVARAHDRVTADAYRRSVLELDALDEEPYLSYREARKEVLAAEGRDRVRLWLKYRIMEPRFDTTTSLRPNQGISAVEADRIASYFVDNGWGKDAASGVESDWRARLANRLPRLRYRYFIVTFVLGLAGGAWIASRRRS